MELILLSQGENEVAVTCDGQHSHTFDPQALPFTENEEEMPSKDNLVVYGKKLYAALFAPGSLARQTLARQPERLLVVPTTTELDTIPWEYAYGSYGGEDTHESEYSEGFLLLECPFVRGLPEANRIAAPTLKGGLHVVGISSEPLSDEVAQLDMATDWTVLAESLQDVPQAMTLERVRPPTLERVRQVVAGQKELVLYFSGHGGQTEEGAILCFEQANGDLDTVPAKDLVHRLRGSVFLVTLSACVSAKPGPTAFSNLAMSLVRQKIPYALGMRFSVYEDDARVFTNVFFSELARGSSVEGALLQTRLELARLERFWMVGAPVLYTCLTEPATGFVSQEGKPLVKDPFPPMEISALPTTEGTFQGRQNELKELGACLTADQRPRLLTLHAGGGQGKSALARALVERIGWAWPGGVWAISLDPLPKQTAFISNLARFLGISSKKGTTTQTVEQQILQRLGQRRTLLVMDNVETLMEALQGHNATALHLMEWINQLLSANATILMVSHMFLGWPDETPYDLLGLSDEIGAMLFRQGAPQRRNEIDRVLAQQLSSRLDGHPLSLRLLAGAFNVSKIEMAAFTEAAEAHLQAAEEKFSDLEHGHQRKLYSWIETSLHFLEPSLQNLLSHLWVFSRPFLPEMVEKLVAPETNTDKKEQGSSIQDQLHQLWLCGLLSYRAWSLSDETLHAYYLEPPLRLFVQHQMKQAQPPEVLLARYATIYASLLENIASSLESQERSARLSVIMSDDFERASAYLTGIEQASFLYKWGWIIYRRGDILYALHLLQQAQDLVKNIQEQSLALSITDRLASIYNHLGQHQKAIQLYREALPIRQASGDRAGEAETLNHLGEAYKQNEQVEEALPLLEQALSIRREIADRSGEALTLNNIASIYRATERIEDALTLYKQALAISREIGNKDEEATTLNGMAEIGALQEKFEDAQQLYNQAYNLFLQVKDNVACIVVMNNLAEIAEKQQKFQQAYEAYESAFSFARTVGDRAAEAITLEHQARLLMITTQPEGALPHYQAALSIFQELEDQISQVRLLSKLATCQTALQQYTEARSTFQAGYEKAQQLSLQRDEIIYLIDLATLLSQHLNLPTEAMHFLEEALSLLQTSGLEKEVGKTAEELQKMINDIRQGIPQPVSDNAGK